MSIMLTKCNHGVMVGSANVFAIFSHKGIPVFWHLSYLYGSVWFQLNANTSKIPPLFERAILGIMPCPTDYKPVAPA